MKVVSLSRIVDVNRLIMAIQRIRCIEKAVKRDFALSLIGILANNRQNSRNLSWNALTTGKNGMQPMSTLTVHRAAHRQAFPERTVGAMRAYTAGHIVLTSWQKGCTN